MRNNVSNKIRAKLLLQLIALLLITVLALSGCGSGNAEATTGGNGPEVEADGDNGPKVEADSEEPAAETGTADNGSQAGTVDNGSQAGTADNGVYLDLSEFNSTMTVTELFNVAAESEEYTGKVIRLKGMFITGTNADGTETLYGCFNQDPTGCCTVIMEFRPKDSYVYPDDFPEEEEDIIIQGEFAIEMDGEYEFMVLNNADIIS